MCWFSHACGGAPGRMWNKASPRWDKRVGAGGIVMCMSPNTGLGGGAHVMCVSVCVCVCSRNGACQMSACGLRGSSGSLAHTVG